jgi:Cu+-exporting ATPase
VAAGVLYPVAGILMSPIFAGAAMALGSVSVVSNSLRVRRVRAPDGA